MRHSLEAVAYEIGGTIVRAAAKPKKVSGLRAERILETALDAFFSSVQKQCHNKYGDIAGEFMAENEHEIFKLLMPYVKSEVEHAQSAES